MTSIVIDKTPGLPAGFLGQLVQVCVVTRDYRSKIEGMLRAGIGPWSVFTFSPDTCTDLTYRGASAEPIFKVCVAEAAGMRWEIIEPVSGPNIYSDFLERGAEGVQHLLFDCNGHHWDDKVATFERAGYACIQSGRWLGRLDFAYYATESVIGTVIEIVNFPPDWQRPEPDETYS